MTLDHGTGWLPDVPKPNDYTEDHPKVAELLAKTALAARIGAAAAPPPPPRAIDLSPTFSPVFAQGMLRSCTAHAAAGLLEYYERRAHDSYTPASRLFLYKVERNLLGWTGDSAGYLRTAMEALALFGAPPERYWPYDGSEASVNTHYDVEPSAFCYALGNNFEALTYFRLDPGAEDGEGFLAKIKAYLAAGLPSMFGFPLYDEFASPLEGGLVAFPAAGSRFYSGHAIVAAGYDDDKMIGAEKGALLVRNSWGPGWGKDGYGWMSYKYVTMGYSADWWTMLTAKWVNTGQF